MAITFHLQSFAFINNATINNVEHKSILTGVNKGKINFRKYCQHVLYGSCIIWTPIVHALLIWAFLLW